MSSTEYTRADYDAKGCLEYRAPRYFFWNDNGKWSIDALVSLLPSRADNVRDSAIRALEALASYDKEAAYTVREKAAKLVNGNMCSRIEEAIDGA